MKLFRCYVCEGKPGMPGKDFAAEVPVCPDCKIDGRVPKYASYVVALKVIHFDPPDPVLGKLQGRLRRGLNHAACNPALPVGKCLASGDPAAVNCPACQQTDIYKSELHDASINPEDDFDLQIDPQKGEMAATPKVV